MEHSRHWPLHSLKELPLVATVMTASIFLSRKAFGNDAADPIQNLRIAQRSDR